MGEFFHGLVSSTLHPLLHALFEVIGTALAAYVVIIAHKYLAKIKIALTEEQDRKLQYLVTQAVLKAEETIVGPGKGPAKFEAALRDVLEDATHVSIAKVKDLITAKVAELGLGHNATPFSSAPEPGK